VTHPLYGAIGDLARLTQRHPALRDGTQINRWSSAAPGIYAFSRVDRHQQREYLVAVNNSESAQTASVPTYMSRTWFERIYGAGERWLKTGSDGRLRVTVPPLSAVVYEATQRVDRSRRAPSIGLKPLGTLRDRAEIGANVGGDGLAEVTFLARSGRGGWKPIGTDDNAPYRVFHDVADLAPGTRLQYTAVVVDNAGHERTSNTRSGSVAAPAIALEAPADGGRVRGKVEVRAVATPEHSNYVVTLYRSVDGGAWTAIGTDDSSPVYTAFDDTAGLPDGATVRYKAVLTYAPGRTVESEPRSVTVVQTQVAAATVHYRRPAGDYADWGLHLWGDAIADGVATTWDAPRQRETAPDAFGAVYKIPLKDDTKPVNFIMHRPSGDVVPDTREPGGDRSFVPLDHPEIWLVQGDPTVYFSEPPH
jgi:alpha-amylase